MRIVEALVMMMRRGSTRCCASTYLKPILTQATDIQLQPSNIILKGSPKREQENLHQKPWTPILLLPVLLTRPPSPQIGLSSSCNYKYAPAPYPKPYTPSSRPSAQKKAVNARCLPQQTAGQRVPRWRAPHLQGSTMHLPSMIVGVGGKG